MDPLKGGGEGERESERKLLASIAPQFVPILG